MMKKKYNFCEFLIGSFFMLIMILPGIMSVLAIAVDFRLIKLWKEFFVIFIFFICIFRCKCKSISVVIIATFFLFILELLYNLIKGIPFEYIAYAWKTDFILYIWGASLYLISKKEKNISIYNLDFVLKILIAGGVVNAVFGIIEAVFFKELLDFFGISKYGIDSGVYIGTAFGYLRPIGLQMGIVQYATLLVFSYITFVENSRLYKGRGRVAVHFLFLIAIISSTYFTAILFLLVYACLKMLQMIFRDKKFDRRLYYSALIICFLGTGLINTSLDFAELFSEISPAKYESSILPRIHQFLIVWEDVSSSIENVLLGVGYGIYGKGGLEVKTNLMDPMAIDSGFLYLLGNYGVIVTLGWIAFLILQIIKNRKYDCVGIKYILLYILAIELFFNNIFRDFPNNFILFMLLTLNHLYVKTQINIEKKDI